MNELIVRKVKDQHNPRKNWQSKEFFMYSVSHNVFLFTNIKRAVNLSAGVVNGGTKHGRVEYLEDVKKVMENLLNESALVL